MPTVSVPSTASTPPQPYTSAVASAASSPIEVKNTRWYIADVTPVSRTRAAWPSNSRDSRSGEPNSFTSSAPDTLNRSVMVVFMTAWSS